VERFARWGFRKEALTPVYGLSEASLAVTFSALGKGIRTMRVDREHLARDGRARPDAEGLELVSLGRPIPGCAVEVVDGAGRLAPPGTVGRVRVRSLSLIEGYLGRPEATAEVLRDGWLDTGDLGFLDAGELFLTGRAKDVLILRGRNYLPTDVEHAVSELAGVRKGCVVAVSHLPEDAAGERLLVFLERAREKAQDDDGALRRQAAEAVLAATGLRADEVLVLDPGTLPRTSSGKLRRSETLRRHLAGALAPPTRVTPLFLVRQLLRSARARSKGRQ